MPKDSLTSIKPIDVYHQPYTTLYSDGVLYIDNNISTCETPSLVMPNSGRITCSSMANTVTING